MSIFKSIEEFEFQDPNLHLMISNMYTTSDHFENTENIIEFGKSLDTALYARESDKNILTNSIYEYLKAFPRIKKVEFYFDITEPDIKGYWKDYQSWIVLIISDMLEFNKSTNFSRGIVFDFKDHKIELQLLELYKSEYKLITDKKEQLPTYWEPQPKMNKQYNRMKILSNDE